MKKIFEVLGGRKLVLGFVVITIGVCMDLFTEKGLSTNLLYLLGFISTSFFLSNAAVSRAYANKENHDSPNPPIEADMTNTRLDLIQEQLNQATSGIATVSQAVSHIIKRAGFDKPSAK